MKSRDAARHRALELLAERAPGAAAALRAAPQALRDSAGAVLAASDFVLDNLVREPPLIWLLSQRADTRLAGAPCRRQRCSREARPNSWLHCGAGDGPNSPASPGAILQAGPASRRLSRICLRAADSRRCGWRMISRCSLLSARHGLPRNPAQLPQQMIIVAMGKLGGNELNFSSDIDLVLLYPENGETDGPRAISNEEFFTRLGQGLIRLLEQATEHGFVFRVDMRLRPFGQSGPLVTSAAALEDYLQIHGRDWERYAWVKARPVTNATGYAELFRSLISPFVFRRYLDFGVLESLREMKLLIERDIQRRELDDDIKLGDGGIREVEFIVQSFQLIRGGRDRRLQGSSLRRALVLLAEARLLPEAVARESR